MNARSFSICSLAILSLGLSAVSCSSEADPVVSGGAQFMLSNIAEADQPADPAPRFGNCLDSSAEKQFVGQQSSDGNIKLVLDGADDAQVSCNVSGGRFNASVSRSNATFTANGSIGPATDACKGGVSNDATVVIKPGLNTYRTFSTKCTVCLSESSGGRLWGVVTCPLLEHTLTPNACRTSTTGEETKFGFVNCSG
jgi:hypothetical protein